MHVLHLFDAAMDCLEDSNYNVEMSQRSHFSDSYNSSDNSSTTLSSAHTPNPPIALIKMDTSDSAKDDRSQASKKRFWNKVRRTREKRRNRFMREDYLLPSRFDICTRRSSRNFVRFCYLTAACAFSSLVTLYVPFLLRTCLQTARFIFRTQRL